MGTRKLGRGRLQPRMLLEMTWGWSGRVRVQDPRALAMVRMRVSEARKREEKFAFTSSQIRGDDLLGREAIHCSFACVVPNYKVDVQRLHSICK